MIPIGIAALVIVGAVTLLAWLSARKVLRALRIVTEGLRRLAAGEWDVALVEDGAGRLTDLAHAFNAAVKRLKVRQDELRHAMSWNESVLQTALNAYVAMDEKGMITAWNPAAERIFRWSADQAIGKPMAMIIPHRYRAAHREGLQRYLETGVAQMLGERVELPALRRGDQEFPVEMTITPVAHHGAARFHAFIADITERHAAEARLRDQARIIEQAEDAITSKSRNGEITQWNPAAERLYGYTAQEAIGQPISILVPPERAGEEFELLDRALAGETIEQLETTRLRKDGSTFDVSITVSALHNEWGEPVGTSIVTRDISAQKRAELERERALLELNEAQRIAGVGSWGWDPKRQEARWSVEMHRIFGRPEELGPAVGQELLDYVEPEDRARVANAYGELFGERSVFEVDYRIRSGHGHARWLHALAHEDALGRYAGIVQDVTELRLAEGALEAAEERLRLMFENAPIGEALLSLDGRIEQANPALGSLSGRTRGELEGMRLRELLHPGDVAQGTDALKALVAGESEQLSLELRLMPVTGSPVTVSVNGTLLRDVTGEPLHALCQLQDVTERKRFEAQLQFMADHDPLTGLLNRHKFEAELHRHVTQVKRYGAEGALIVLDIDHFKQVNDTLGHNAGDELIVSIASVLRGRLRESDLLARLGGDEFAILLPKADEEEAAQVAADLVKAIRTSATLLGGERKLVTTSAGVSMFEFDTSNDQLTGETILIEADLAMYDAKEAGRDRFAFYAKSPHRISRTQARLTWANRIEDALEHDKFALVAQSILDLRTSKVGQYELLIRMVDDHGDLIPPATFLYIAERFRIIGRVDEWVTGQAIQLIAAQPELHLEVNISGRSLGDQRLLDAIEYQIEDAGIDPTHLIFEVTETAAVANIAEARAFAQRLRDLGCRFALDDFGAGFGSFYYLKHLPFDYVKIDGEFVQHVVRGHIDQLVIEAVVRIAQGMGKETIAEFVTDETTQRIVQRLGVDFAQGYNIGKPVPVAELVTA